MYHTHITTVCPVHVFHWDTGTDMECTYVLTYTRITAICPIHVYHWNRHGVYLCTNVHTYYHCLSCLCLPLGHWDGHGVYLCTNWGQMWMNPTFDCSVEVHLTVCLFIHVSGCTCTNHSASERMLAPTTTCITLVYKCLSHPCVPLGHWDRRVSVY